MWTGYVDGWLQRGRKSKPMDWCVFDLGYSGSDLILITIQTSWNSYGRGVSSACSVTDWISNLNFMDDVERLKQGVCTLCPWQEDLIRYFATIPVNESARILTLRTLCIRYEMNWDRGHLSITSKMNFDSSLRSESVNVYKFSIFVLSFTEREKWRVVCPACE